MIKCIHRAIGLFLLVILAANPACAQRTATVTQKVKSTGSYFIFSEDGHLWPQTWPVVAQNFTPGPSRTIAPSSGDPNAVTANPYVVGNCPVVTSSSPQAGVNFTAHFNSLRDVGTWTITFNGTWFNPDYCGMLTHPPCNILCDPLLLSDWSEPFQYIINVVNDAPTGHVSFGPNPVHWGDNVTLDGNGSDPDGGSVNYQWSIIQQPAGSSATLSSTSIRSPQIHFNHEKDIGHWRFRVNIDDDEGERKTFEADLDVPNVPPSITLGVSPGNPMDVLQTMTVTASPTTDVDGGNLTFNWNVTGPTAYPGPVNNSSITFVTTEAAITTFSDGTDFRPLWHIQCTATDNESATDVKTVDVRVKNKPPRIDAAGFVDKISTGGTMYIETAIIDDDDGGPLTFKWDIIQAPNSAPVSVQNNFSTNSSINIPTTAAFAGTWRFRLTVRDNEGEEKSEKYSILVDGQPTANITGPMATIGNLSGFPLTLDGGGSVDPDSPEGCANNCHTTSDPPVQISPGIVTYTWYLIDAPTDNPDLFSLGRVDEVLDINGSGQQMVIPLSKRLSPGYYTFQLKVEDGEGNTATTDFTVDVTEEESKPIGIILPPYVIQYVDQLTNVLSADISFNGGFSFDPDNFLSSPITAGISHYNWTITQSPPGCILVPSLGTASSATLFTAGTFIDPTCQGLWKIALTVTDDDALPKTNDPVAESIVVIGNCPGNLCIDYPTTLNSQIIPFSDATDVMIYFHLNSVLYADPLALLGTFARVEIFHEGDVAPFFTDTDPNLFATDLGGYLVFHWNGYGDGHQRPLPGHYHVHLTLLNVGLATTIGGDIETDAILIQVADPAILATSDQFIDRDKLQANTDQVTINYNITGGATPTTLRWKVYDAGNAVVATADIGSPALAGSVNWNGRNGAMVLLPIGDYEMQLESLDGSTTMGQSARYKFSILQADVDADTNRDGVINDSDDANENAWTAISGAIFSVNYDRDGSRTDGGVPIGDAIHFDDSGAPVNEDKVIDNAADEADITPFVIHKPLDVVPAALQVFLKVANPEQIQSIHVFKKIAAGETAIWGSLGSRTGGPAEPLEIDITQWVNPASPSYQGDGAGDVQFGLEGMFFRNTGAINTFSGLVDFTLEIRNGATVIASDVIELKVAPWLMVSHKEPSQQVWVADYGANNVEMRMTASAVPGYFALENSTQMHGVTGSDRGSQWFQDHVEIGYYQRPGGPQNHCVFRLPYENTSAGTMPLWPQSLLIAPAAGTFQIGSNQGAGSGDYGGNLELLPPNAINKNGKIVMGVIRSAQIMTFLTSQEEQHPFEVNTAWLDVGHVDEIFGFTGNSNEAIVADPNEAYSIMNAIAPAMRGKSVFYATGTLPIDGTVTSVAGVGNRINTGVDHTAGPAWQYIRIYSGAATGQIAHISSLQNGFILIDEVWNTGSILIPASATTYAGCVHNPRPSTSNWAINPAVGDKYVLMEDTRFWESGVPSAITVAEVLADPELAALNTTDIQNEITTIKNTIQTQNGAPMNYIKVPTIYLGERPAFATSRTCEALTPGLANFQSVNGNFYFPRQFGPRNAAGEDLFEKLTRTRVPIALFTDDWNLYHAKMGEVHCGTTTKRNFPLVHWW
jgi:hypothetical protein